MRSFENLRSVDPGFTYRHVAFLQLEPRMGAPKINEESYASALVQQLSSLPGVRSVALSQMLPGLGFGGSEHVRRDTAGAGVGLDADDQIVSPNYFRTLGLNLLRGRDFRRQDDERAPRVVIISQSLARRMFPSADAIGNHIVVGTGTEQQDSEIVGIVNDARIRDFQERWPYIIYSPYFQRPSYTGSWTNVEMLVTDASPNLFEAATQRVNSLGREYVLLSGPLKQVIDTGLAGQRTMAYAAAFFSGLALLLAAVGLYGLMSYTVTQRTREIGIRTAFGAQRGAILRMVLLETLVLLVGGFSVGLPCALAATHLVAHMLFGLSPNDPATLVIVASALAAVGVLAGYIPARRATKIDPMVALRYE